MLIAPQFTRLDVQMMYARRSEISPHPRSINAIILAGAKLRVLAIIVPRRTPKTTTFGKNFPTHGARLQPESASHGAPQARKQAIWGDLGRFSSQNRLPRSRTPPKIASHEVVLRGTIIASTRNASLLLGGKSAIR